MRGTKVTVLDPDPEKFERLRHGFGGRKLTGIGINEDFLRRAGLQEAGAFLALSGDDRARRGTTPMSWPARLPSTSLKFRS